VWHQSRDENTAQGRKIRLAARMQRRGGQGKSGDAWRGARRGGWLPPQGTARAARHGRYWPGRGMHGWHACPHSGAWH
jgi:hypothetical protein